MKTYLKMPFSWGRNSDSSTENQGSQGRYWSSEPSTVEYEQAYYLNINSTGISPSANIARIYGRSIRPFKNDAVQPDSSWTKLY
jgi:hypothetical protein